MAVQKPMPKQEPMAEQKTKKIMFVDRNLDIYGTGNNSMSEVLMRSLQALYPGQIEFKRIQVSPESGPKVPSNEYQYNSAESMHTDLKEICKKNNWSLDCICYAGSKNAYYEGSCGWQTSASLCGFTDFQFIGIPDLEEDPEMDAMTDYIAQLGALLGTYDVDTKPKVKTEDKKEEKKPEHKEEEKKEKEKEKTKEQQELDKKPEEKPMVLEPQYQPTSLFFAQTSPVSSQIDEQIILVLSAKTEAESVFKQSTGDAKELAQLGARYLYLSWMNDYIIKNSELPKKANAEEKIAEIAKGVLVKAAMNGKSTASIPKDETERKNAILISADEIKDKTIKNLHEKLFGHDNTMANKF
jgi:hypothetical protein